MICLGECHHVHVDFVSSDALPLHRQVRMILLVMVLDGAMLSTRNAYLASVCLKMLPG